jgi:ferric-dicitrate binding protein FerR (iron transport regulator)
MYAMIMRVAASVLVFAMAAYSIYYLLGEEKDIQLTAQADIQQVELSEGSQVTINSNTTLTYPKKFVGNKREVELSGEAYFEVAEDPNRPFIIHAGAIQVEVLGTSFNVKAYEHLNQIEVTVASGKVAVYATEAPDDRVVLVKGQMAYFYKEEVKIEKKLNENINFASWKTKQIIFEDTPMPDVIRIINEIYKSDLRLVGDELISCPVTTTFEDQSLDSILKVLETTFDFTINRKDQYIEISGGGC